MCDFRRIKKIRFNATGEVIDVSENTMVCRVSPEIGLDIPVWNELTEPGFYHVAASGSFYVYFDGTKILSEGEDYEVVELKSFDFPQYITTLELSEAGVQGLRPVL